VRVTEGHELAGIADRCAIAVETVALHGFEPALLAFSSGGHDKIDRI
jgi:hypothetical protein